MQQDEVFTEESAEQARVPQDEQAEQLEPNEQIEHSEPANQIEPIEQIEQFEQDDQSEQVQQRDLGAEELQQSFSAFKTRLSQGRELKFLRRDLAQHQKALQAMRDTYSDNCDILQNFSQIVGALYDVVEGNAKIISSTRATIARVDAAEESLKARLKEAEQEHAQALVPESDELYAKNTELANAQAAVKGAKAAVSAARKAMKSEEAGQLEQDALAAAQAELEAAENWHGSAREAQKAAERVYNVKAEGFKKAENTMKDELRRLNKERTRNEKEIAELEEKSNAAKARLDRCEHVKQNPAETDELAVQIEQAVADEAQMVEAIRELEEAHETSKKSSTLARNIVAVLIGCVVVIVVGTLLAKIFLQ